MQAQIPHSTRGSLFLHGDSPAVATLPENSISVKNIHTAEYIKIYAFIPSTRKPLKEKDKYHTSLQICFP
jgi:hypothetical protein